MKEEIPGLVKRCIALRDFDFQGRPYKKDQEMELTSNEVLELSGLRKPPVRMLNGGRFEITKADDGFHYLKVWSWPGMPDPNSSQLVRVELLQDYEFFLCKKGDRRRLPINILREHPYRYLDSPAPSKYLAVPQPDPVFLIHENRPKRLSDEDKALQFAQAAVGAPLSNSWMSPALKA